MYPVAPFAIFQLQSSRTVTIGETVLRVSCELSTAGNVIRSETFSKRRANIFVQSYFAYKGRSCKNISDNLRMKIWKLATYSTNQRNPARIPRKGSAKLDTIRRTPRCPRRSVRSRRKKPEEAWSAQSRNYESCSRDSAVIKAGRPACRKSKFISRSSLSRDALQKP